MSDRPFYLVLLTPNASGRGDVVDLRRWLKTALRMHGLRAVAAVEVLDVGVARATMNAVGATPAQEPTT